MTIFLKKYSWIVAIFVMIYILGGTFISDSLLKIYGKCGKGILLNETIRVRYSKADLYYNFYYRDKTYKGNSLEENLAKAGDSVCVVYLPSFPSINRAWKYFNKEKVKCDCDQ